MRQVPFFFSKMLKGFVFRNVELFLIHIVTKNDLYMIKLTDMLFHIFEGKKRRIFTEIGWGHGDMDPLSIS